MSTFIKLPIVHFNNIEGDTDLFLNIEEISEVVVASEMDKRQRSEIKSFITKKNGQMLATSLSANEVIDRLQELSIS